MSRSEPVVVWLAELGSIADRLPRHTEPKRYYSERRSGDPDVGRLTLPAVCRRFRKLIGELAAADYFSKDLGWECVDASEAVRPFSEELGERISKADLWDTPPESWAEEDLYDFIEVAHDLVARPIRRSFHSYAGCGWHPEAWSRRSGRALYTWMVNGLLSQSVLDLRLADGGEDAGRVVRAAPDGLADLVADMVEAHDEEHDEVAHAIHLFRKRGATANDQRSAILALTGVLEERRVLVDERLFTRDANDLFEIANRFGLRHRRRDQQTDYGDEFLGWIFHYYLATVQLTDDLLARSADAAARSPSS